MKKTIKAEMERTFISSEFLNENSLLVMSKEEKDEYPTLSVRYVERDTIKEDRIATLLPTISVQHNDSVIGVFITCPSRTDALITVYDLDDHTYVENDFLRTVYDSKTANKKPVQYTKSNNS